MVFNIDERIESTSIFLADWPLCRVFLKNEQAFPWFVLVPRKDNIQEIHQLELKERQTLMEEIHQLSLLVQNYFKPDKINIGALGNIVSQLHIHVVARTKQDLLWPQGIWQSAMNSTPYEDKHLLILLESLKNLIDKVNFF